MGIAQATCLKLLPAQLTDKQACYKQSRSYTLHDVIICTLAALEAPIVGLRAWLGSSASQLAGEPGLGLPPHPCTAASPVHVCQTCRRLHNCAGTYHPAGKPLRLHTFSLCALDPSGWLGAPSSRLLSRVMTSHVPKAPPQGLICPDQSLKAFDQQQLLASPIWPGLIPKVGC